MVYPIPAIFFTYDQDQETALFTLQSYLALWPNLPLKFVIPYNHLPTMADYRCKLPSDLKCSFVFAKPAVAATLFELLEAVLLQSDSQWFFWCTSDRIPVGLATPALSDLASTLLETQLPNPIDAVRLTRWRESAHSVPIDSTIELADIPFNVSTVLPLFGFWHPQFVSRRFLYWLKDVAFSCKEETSGDLRDFQQALKRACPAVTNFKVLLPRLTVAKFTEPTDEGKWTLNYRVDRFRAGLSVGKAPDSTQSWITFANANQDRKNNFWLQQQATPGESLDSKEDDVQYQNLIQRTFPPLPIIVVTYGGSGSKFLLKNLYPNKLPSELPEAHSHWRVPPMTIEPEQKLIYIFGDPRNSVLSFFARRHSLTHLHGFEVRPREVQPQYRKLKIINTLKNLETDAGPITEEWDLEQFLEHEVEQFRLEEHFDCWTYSRLNYPVYFCRYETLWENWGHLQSTLGVTRNDLPEKENRRSNWIDLPEPQKTALNKMLGDFALRLEALPDLFEVKHGIFTDLKTNTIFVPRII